MRASRVARILAWMTRPFAGPRSQAFETFREYVFGCRRAPGGLEAVMQLRGGERRRAERMLLRAAPDARVIEALGALASRRAARRLSAIYRRQTAEAARGREAALLVACAATLWRLSPADRYAEAVAARLGVAPTRGERMDAAAALANMPTPLAEEALAAALDDRDALVRHVAARALLEMHGVTVDARAVHHIVHRVLTAEPEQAGRRRVAAAFDDAETALLRSRSGP